ncbi:MAG: hypothetical protein JWM18_5113 [Chloroflexi bacterium]|nr:hypothetical protein [Chloroflexota bacterium]
MVIAHPGGGAHRPLRRLALVLPRDLAAEGDVAVRHLDGQPLGDVGSGPERVLSGAGDRSGSAENLLGRHARPLPLLRPTCRTRPRE